MLQKFLPVYLAMRFIALFTKARHFTLSGTAQFIFNALFLVLENSLQHSHPILPSISFTMALLMVFKRFFYFYLSFMNLVNRHFKILFVELLSIRIEICSNDNWKCPVISTGKVTESRRNWNVVQIVTNCHVIRFIILWMQIDMLMIRTLCQQLRKVCIIQCVYFTT